MPLCLPVPREFQTPSLTLSPSHLARMAKKGDRELFPWDGFQVLSIKCTGSMSTPDPLDSAEIAEKGALRDR